MNSTGASPATPYLNRDKGIQTKYPSDWTKHDEFPPGGPLVVFSTLPEGPMDVYREYVLIGSGELQPGTTLEAFVQNVIGQAKQQATDATSVETDTVLSGLPAKQVILTGRIGPMSLRSLNIFAMSGNRLYHVLYSAEASKFDKFFGGAQTIINSLKVY